MRRSRIASQSWSGGVSCSRARRASCARRLFPISWPGSRRARRPERRREKEKPPPVLRAGASDPTPVACLHREAQAHVEPGQHAELGRVRVAERQALAGQRLESDPELETAIERL